MRTFKCIAVTLATASAVTAGTVTAAQAQEGVEKKLIETTIVNNTWTGMTLSEAATLDNAPFVSDEIYERPEPNDYVRAGSPFQSMTRYSYLNEVIGSEMGTSTTWTWFDDSKLTYTQARTTEAGKCTFSGASAAIYTCRITTQSLRGTDYTEVLVTRK